MIIDIKEVEVLVKEIPAVARAVPGVKLLVGFVGKVVRAVNQMDERLKALEVKTGTVNPTPPQE